MSIKIPDGNMLYGKPNWRDQQPRRAEVVFPLLTPHWYDMQISMDGVGDFEYEACIRHHVNAMTDYLIGQGHEDISP
eukprot:3732066-Heterocapsa_arctica.AAC.1